MKTTDMKEREIAIALAAHAAYMARVRAGLIYDVVKLAWVRPEDCTIGSKGLTGGVAAKGRVVG